MTRAWLALAVPAAACTAPAEPRASLVDAPTLIAVATRPAEAAPGDEVAVTVVVATPDGPGDASGARWAPCTAPRPATDNNAVAAACLGDGATPIDAVGATVRVTLAPDACALFGPDPPPGGFRPRDPDPSGGYYQPVRVEVDDLVGFAMARVRCPLGNAPLDATLAYAAGYEDNVVPVVGALEVAPAAVHAGDSVALTVRWPDTTAEPYLLYDPVTQTLHRTIEHLTVSWYVTAGEVADDRTIGGAAGATVAWTAPDAAGPAHAWAVVRDDRGGIAVADLAVDVAP